MRALAAAVGLAGLSSICGCAREDPRFSTPATTYQTYREAIASADAEASWACLSGGYRTLEFGGSFARWEDTLAVRQVAMAQDLRRREISREQEINARLGYLQFDPSTVGERSGTFFYFLRDSEGWKITSHLDTLFRVELEGAIDRGEFQLPLR